MKVPVRRELSNETSENVMHIGVADVVEKAIDQDEVKLLLRISILRGNISHLKPPVVLSSCALNVTGIDVDPKIVCLRKDWRIGARPAADIENPADSSEVIVPKNRCEFVRYKGRLPEPVDRRLL